MNINVSGLEPGKYAEMVRENGNWILTIDGAMVGQVKDTHEFYALGRDHYRILGVGEGIGRVIRFADLHRHSDCSLLDGMTKIPEMVERTEYAGALTDHGNMYGFLEYYKAMNAVGKQPIIGFEGYIADMDGTLNGRHIIFLAKNDVGVKNLFKLTSDSFNNFKRKPHVTWNMLHRHHEGIICLTACLGGLVPAALRAGDMGMARRILENLIDIFGKEDVYVEIQRHGLQEEPCINGQLIQLAKTCGVKVVATTDAHYPNEDDKNPHEVLLCLQTGKTMADPMHLKYNGSGYFLHNSEEMENLFSDIPEALDNTLEIADRCQVNIKLHDVNLPQYAIPDGFKTPTEYMEHLAKQGFKDRFGGTPHETDKTYLDRFAYEIDMIKKMGFESYFIIVWDFINYARNNNIYVGPGRGSAAGSIVAYCMGITDLDPIKYNLLFERFLNPERVSWPDIDTDIEFSGRSKVIQYMIHKYGAENVCRIVTFGTMAAKQAVRDVGRCLGLPAWYSTKLAGMIPKAPGMTIKAALDMAPDFKLAYDSDHDARTIIDIAMRLEGSKRHASQHACGLALAPSPVSDFLPTSMEKDTESGERALASQVVMTEVEELSLIKMDLLGLKNMGVIHEVIDRVLEEYGKDAVLKKIGSTHDEVRYQDIPLNDRAMYQMLAKGLTGGVFQLESEGMTKIVQQMLSDVDSLPESRMDECFERLVAAVALYRPGPMEYIPNYIAGMKDSHNVQYLTPELESILKPTYGVIVFQEQVMQIVQKLAGYSLGRADLVRKAMGKKKQAIMDAERKVFIYGNLDAYNAGKDENYAPGCINNGIPEFVAEKIWDQMADFAKYAFNRSHAVCYAYIAAITAYMSCHWTAEFYAALLNAFIENSDKVKAYLSQASRRNIHLLPPDINRSECTFKPENGDIRFGLQGISGVKSAAEQIVSERKANGPFNSLQDLYERMGDRGSVLNKKSLEGLIYAGSLSSFSVNKAALLAQLPLLEKNYKRTAQICQMGQMVLFSKDEMQVPLPDVPPLPSRAEQDFEYKAIGMYLSNHPADEVDAVAVSAHVCRYKPIATLKTLTSMKEVATGGMICNLKQFYTKKGARMASFELETKYESISCVVFPNDYEKCMGELADTKVVFVMGDLRYDDQREMTQLVVTGISSIESAKKKDGSIFDVTVSNKDEQDRVLDYISKHPGPNRVRLIGNGRSVVLAKGFEACQSAIDYLSGGYKAPIPVSF